MNVVLRAEAPIGHIESEGGYQQITLIIEGTCKNLINDRMERSGMRWSPEGAEAILKLRSLHLTGLWNDFWTFRTQREKKAIHSGQRITMKQQPYHWNVDKAA